MIKFKKILCVAYLYEIIYITLLSRYPMECRIFEGPFWELSNAMYRDIVLNILLFIPLGFLLGENLKKNLIIGSGISMTIEVVQYISMLGYCEVDDVMNNVIGVVAGTLIYRFARKMLMLREWNDLPEFMRCDEVKPYYDVLRKKRVSLIIKRIFDIVVSLILLVILAIPMLIIAIMIKADSEGPVFYRQERVTSYGKKFKIHKFRTMVNNADKIGTAVTVGGDTRITCVGKKIRDLRIDEIPQLIDVFVGNMSFVGTRPEATKYVQEYTNEMYATLLLPAGITSEASIRYKDEAKWLDSASDVDKVYVEEVLPQKMEYNLKNIMHFNLKREISTIVRTVCVVLNIIEINGEIE